jgi:precorrin-3B synthase
MTTAENLRKGWCPGALRPMQTGDGLLVRVRPRAGTYSLAALSAIADAAARFGSGEIDLTNRANLQLRGLREDSYGEAIPALAAAGLIDDDAEAEAVRNVVVDPLSGLDPARMDMRPLAGALERRLVETTALHALPGKFGFALNGSLASKISSDIIVTARDARSCVVQLDGAAGQTAAIVAYDDAVDAAVRLGQTFLDVAKENPDIRRMRDAMAVVSEASFFARSGLQVAAGMTAAHEQDLALAGAIGPSTAPFAVAFGLPFGRIGADALRALCDGAAAAGCSDIRPTAGRTMVLPVRSVGAARALVSLAQSLGLITDPADARLKFDVCPGAPACRNAMTPTRDDASRLITGLALAGIATPSVHISGCNKGCARRDTATLTFVGHDGAYDLIRDGTADGRPAMSGISPSGLAAAAIAVLDGRLS